MQEATQRKIVCKKQPKFSNFEILNWHTSERQNLDLAKLILTADQINLNPLQCIAQNHQFINIYKSKLLKNNFCVLFKKENCIK
jgi:hypothetical protein